jgi:uncharacterized membrane protein
MSLSLVLEVLAAVLILLAAIKTPEPPKLSFGWCGVFLLVVVLVLGGIRL